jgi:hypothetical protein
LCNVEILRYCNDDARSNYIINDNITAGETLGHSDPKSNVIPEMIVLVSSTITVSLIALNADSAF